MSNSEVLKRSIWVLRDKKCWECGKEFIGHYNNRYCTLRCKLDYFNACRRAGLVLRKKESPETKRIRRKEYRKRHKLAGLCKHCSRPVVTQTLCVLHIRKLRVGSRIRKAKDCWGIMWQEQVLLLEINDAIRSIQNEEATISC